MSEIVLTGDGPKIPQIPTVPISDQNVRTAVEGIRNIFNTRAFGKNEVDRWVTWRDLVKSNIVVYRDGDTTFTGNQGGNFFPIGEDPADFTPPPAPVNLTAVSAALTVILEWDDPQYANLAYAEIWRSTTNDLGAAVRIGTTVSFLYADAVGAGSITYYYWVRLVSKKDIVGAYNSLIGTMAATGLIGNVDLGPLIVEAANLAVDAVEEGKIKDFAVTTTKIANLAVGNAAIANGAITNAKIENLAVDSAKIADAAIVAAKIADATITTAKIGDAQITGAKIANATIGTANITDGAITNALIGDAQISTAKIQTAAITNAKILDATITGAKIASATIGTALIADAAIVSALIADAAIVEAKIASAAISSAKIQDAAITNAKIGSAAITSAKIGDLEVGTIKIAGNAVSFGGAVVGSGAAGFYTAVGGTLAVTAYAGGTSNGGNLFYIIVDGTTIDTFPAGAPVWRNSGGDAGALYIEAYGAMSGVSSIYLGPGSHSVGFYLADQAYSPARIIWNFFQR
jgi:uncharacterized protein YjbI with pentapeptide repeats